jgi:Tfp pilus assembly protein PilV
MKITKDIQKLKHKTLFTIHQSLIINSGQSLFEVVVAVGLSALILVGIASLAAASVRNSSFSRNNAQATKFAQEEIEWLRSQRDADWATFTPSIGGGCSGSFSWGGSCPITSTIFTRSAVFTCSFFDPVAGASSVPCNSLPDNINIVDVEVSVVWSDAQGDHQVKSNTRLTNWRI